MKCQRPIEGIQSIKIQSNYLSIIFTFCISKLNFFNPDMLFFLRLYGAWGRSGWPTDPRATQGVLVPTGSLLDGRLLDPRRNAPTRLVWSVHRTDPIGWCSGAARCAAACCTFSTRCSTHFRVNNSHANACSKASMPIIPISYIHDMVLLWLYEWEIHTTTQKDILWWYNCPEPQFSLSICM